MLIAHNLRQDDLICVTRCAMWRSYMMARPPYGRPSVIITFSLSDLYIKMRNDLFVAFSLYLHSTSDVSMPFTFRYSIKSVSVVSWSKLKTNSSRICFPALSVPDDSFQPYRAVRAFVLACRRSRIRWSRGFWKPSLSTTLLSSAVPPAALSRVFGWCADESSGPVETGPDRGG